MDNMELDDDEVATADSREGEDEQPNHTESDSGEPEEFGGLGLDNVHKDRLVNIKVEGPVESEDSTRPIVPLPKKAEKTTLLQVPLPSQVLHRPSLPSDPSLVPKAATVPRTTIQKANNRRLIVVLEKACLESYRVSAGSAKSRGKDGKGGAEAKYALLNCDDHQGILAKTGRDIADARPDITHQVGGCQSTYGHMLTFLPSVSSHVARLTVE